MGLRGFRLWGHWGARIWGLRSEEGIGFKTDVLV